MSGGGGDDDAIDTEYVDVDEDKEFGGPWRLPIAQLPIRTADRLPLPPFFFFFFFQMA